MTRRGTGSRDTIAVAATASGGEMIAPTANATAHGIPGIRVCAATATAIAVTSTSPIARSEIGPMLRRNSRGDVNIAADQRIGGRNTKKTRSGSRSGIFIAVVRPIARPASSCSTGVGIGNYAAAYPNYYITIFTNSLDHAHNYYINMAAETGIFGLLAFLFFIAAIFIAGAHAYRTINRHYVKLKKQRAHPLAGTSSLLARSSFARLVALSDDRALAIGLLASLISVCVHNTVDDLYVHSMTILFALLVVILIRLERVTFTGEDTDHRR